MGIATTIAVIGLAVGVGSAVASTRAQKKQAQAEQMQKMGAMAESAGKA